MVLSEVSREAAASSMGHYTTDADAAVTKAELLYYFASICKPEQVIASNLVPKAVQLFDEFDKNDSGDLNFEEFYDFYEYAMDMSIQAYGPVEFLLWWFVHPMLTQMGGEQFSLQSWKGEMRGGLVNQKLELTMDINPELICSPTSGRDGGECQRASFGTSGSDGWDSARVDDDSLYVQGYYYDEANGDTTFKPKVSCARTHALAQTTLQHTLADLLGVHAGMIDVTEHGTNTVKDQQVAHAGKACPAIKVTLNVPNASKTLAALEAITDDQGVPCAPSTEPRMCLQIAKVLGMEYLYKAFTPGFATKEHYGNPTGGQVETAYTASNEVGYADLRPFFGANGASYTAAIVEPSCPAELGKGLLTLNATEVNDWADTIIKQADYTATWADLGPTDTYSQVWRDVNHEIDSKLPFSAFPGRRLHTNDPSQSGNYGGSDAAHSHLPSTGKHPTNGNGEVSFPKFSTKAGASWMLLKHNNMPTSTTPVALCQFRSDES